MVMYFPFEIYKEPRLHMLVFELIEVCFKRAVMIGC